MKNRGQILAPIKRAVSNMVSRAVIKLVNDGTLLQSVQVAILNGETRSEAERFQQYGFTSHPLPGAEAVVIFVGGNRDHPLVTNIDDRRYRPKNIAPGEAVVYNHLGDYVHVKVDGTIEVKATTRVDIDAPLVRMTGDLEVEGDITDRYLVNENTINGMRQIYNIHTHPENNSGSTNEPNQLMD